ncbi:MAG: DUF2905 domain-containing protein [Chitinophagales bacterium]|nr:DUF2905 domain-containing protein [Chitinophagales bacterium]
MNEGQSALGKWLIITGAILIIAGIGVLLMNKFSWPAKLPGDIVIRRKNFTLYFPVVTSIVLSLLVTLIFYLVNKFRQ